MALKDKTKAAEIKKATAVEEPAQPAPQAEQKVRGREVIAVEEAIPQAHRPKQITGTVTTITIGRYNHEVIVVDELPDSDKAYISFKREHDWGGQGPSLFLIVNGRKLVKLAKGATLPGRVRAIERLGLGQHPGQPGQLE